LPLASALQSAGFGDEFPVGVAADDVGEHDRRQASGLVHLTPAALHDAVLPPDP
jgi:hypothetical protein